jgi:hypothetical protein
VHVLRGYHNAEATLANQALNYVLVGDASTGMEARIAYLVLGCFTCLRRRQELRQRHLMAWHCRRFAFFVLGDTKD